MNDRNALLRRLPAVDALLQNEGAATMLESWPHTQVVGALREVLDGARRSVLGGGDLPEQGQLLESAKEHLGRMDRAGLCRVVNATGIVLHTGLGRAVLPPAAMEALQAEGAGYCLLAIDAETNERGRRERFVESVLKEITGCEAATVVNNNAAAVLLTLNTLGAGKEVIVSRGQLVEIGGSYRMPDVMDASGCRMVEVGCTNRTHLSDYANAITQDTGAIIRVHPSNYRIQGFTKEVPLSELAALGREHGIPVIDDLGSGAMVPVRPEFDEPLVRESLAAGVDLVTCSADKLIGGPQGGIILGSWELVRRCERNQMSRALRVGKLDLIALEATVKQFRDLDNLAANHPTSRMLGETAQQVGKRANRLSRAIRKRVPVAEPKVEDGVSYAGSGALPIKEIPTRVVSLRPPGGLGANEAARRLRTGDVPVFVRVRSDRLVLDPRTIQPGEDKIIIEALAALG